MLLGLVRGLRQTHLQVRCRHASSSSVVVSCKKLSFGYTDDRLLLDEAEFSIRAGSKVTIMGQNGAGKSSILKLLNGYHRPTSGNVNLALGQSVGTAQQTMAAEAREMRVDDYFAAQFETHPGPGLPAMVAKTLALVKLEAPVDRIIKSFSGGQQARLLLAAALIQDPDILLLDEPTNNLDKEGIAHLRGIVQRTDKTCVVISHDEAFLNSFTDAVLYLDVFSKKVEQYAGDYTFVKSEIEARMARENSENLRLTKAADAKKDQANKFANKGGGLRKVAKRMRTVAAEMKDNMKDVRREDVALKPFDVPFSGEGMSELLTIGAVTARAGGELSTHTLKGGKMVLGRGSRVLVHGPNGVGKTTFLELLASNQAEGCTSSATIGYYRQDFNNFDFDATAMSCLEAASAGAHGNQQVRATAAAFMLRNDQLTQQVKTLSEGQKGLLSLACLVLQEPAVLIMDEPTNHINFRHLPALAKAVSQFDGAVILVSHDTHFVKQIKIDQSLDIGYELGLTEEVKLKKGGKGGKKGKKKKGKKSDWEMCESCWEPVTSCIC